MFIYKSILHEIELVRSIVSSKYRVLKRKPKQGTVIDNECYLAYCRIFQ